MSYIMFHYGEQVSTAGCQPREHDPREYVIQNEAGEFRWLDGGELVDGPSLIALDDSETDAPFLGRADGADAIAQLIGDSVRYPYYCHVYGPMSFEEYRGVLDDGAAYAAEYAALYPRE